MPLIDDMELLREYALRNSEEAFATLVTRHIDLVYAAAWRQVGNHHHAEEITQAVFVILAQKARSLGPGTVLPAWLFRTARLTAANHSRAEIRRTRREQEAFMRSNPTDAPDPLWEQMAPVLNDVIDGLREKDRSAIVLRFLQGKDYKQVAAALGATEEAAQMRVSRALEKMRKLFGKKGIVVSATTLGGLLAANSVQAAPASLTASVAAAVVHGATLSASTLTLTEATLKLMVWTKTKLAVAASLTMLLAYQYHQNSVQAQSLASARENLRQVTEAFAAQENRIGHLQEQTAAIVETRRSQEMELERLRARRKASSTQPNSSGTASSTLLSAMLRDPGAREVFRTQIVNTFRMRYGPFAKELNISAETGEQLVQIAGDGAMKVLDSVAAFTEGTVTADAVLKIEAETLQNGTNEARLKLGEEAFARFEEYTHSYPADSLVRQFDRQLGPFSLSAYQRAALTKVIQDEPFDLTRQLAGEVPVKLVVYPEELGRRFEEQEETNRRILQKAAQFLSTEQVESLRRMQAYNLSAAKRQILQMLRKS